MDTAQWAQGIGVMKRPMEEGNNNTITNNNNNSISTRPAAAPSAAPNLQSSQQQLVERRTRPLKEQALNCPRCNSTNTKFCYYNNYSLTQPRYFCKTCRRYWTEGGSLRNVPVGGGSRKNKRHSSSCSPHTPTTTATTTKINTLQTPPHPAISGQPTKPFHGQDLNLAFPNNSFSELIGGFPAGELSAMELLRSTGIGGSRGLGSLVHMSMPEVTSMYGPGFGLHDFGTAGGIKYPMDGIGGVSNGGDNRNVMQEGGGRFLFPFGDLKPVPMKAGGGGGESDHHHQQSRGEQGGEAPMFWAGANLGGGGGSW